MFLAFPSWKPRDKYILKFFPQNNSRIRIRIWISIETSTAPQQWFPGRESPELGDQGKNLTMCFDKFPTVSCFTETTTTFAMVSLFYR
jgi:hypothetical protein